VKERMVTHSLPGNRKISGQPIGHSSKHPVAVPYLQEALTIAKFEPGIYDVVESFAPPRDEI